MIDRGELIGLIGRYGQMAADFAGTTVPERIAAGKAIEDFCDAAILAEREACAKIASDFESGRNSADAIRARPAP